MMTKMCLVKVSLTSDGFSLTSDGFSLTSDGFSTDKGSLLSSFGMS